MSPPSPSRAPPLLRQRGVGLIEIMVSVVLGLLVIGGVLSLYLGNRWNYRTHQQLGRIQENARFAFELMMRETRDAGLLPCGSAITANVIRNSDAVPWWADTAAGMVRGFDGTDDAAAIVKTGTEAGERKAATDALLVLRPAGTERDYGRIAVHDAETHTFQLAASLDDLQPGDVTLVCDSQSAALLQLATAGIAPTYAGAPLNCTDQLGNPTGTACASGGPKTFAAGGLLIPWAPAFWYVGTSSRGGSSLYRISIAKGTRADAVEMIPAVSDLQVDYLRQGGTGVEGRWVDATAVGTAWNSGTSPLVAVRARITLVAEGSNAADGQPLTRTLIAVATLRNATP